MIKRLILHNETQGRAGQGRSTAVVRSSCGHNCCLLLRLPEKPQLRIWFREEIREYFVITVYGIELYWFATVEEWAKRNTHGAFDWLKIWVEWYKQDSRIFFQTKRRCLMPYRLKAATPKNQSGEMNCETATSCVPRAPKTAILTLRDADRSRFGLALCRPAWQCARSHLKVRCSFLFSFVLCRLRLNLNVRPAWM